MRRHWRKPGESHFTYVDYQKRHTPCQSTGSEAFLTFDVSRVRRSGSRQLLINSEATPPLPLTVFFLAVSQALSKSSCADCQKASLPEADTSVPVYRSKTHFA